MTAVQVLLLAALGAASGYAVLGLVASPLRLEERIAVATLAAFGLDAIACFLLSLALGLGSASILLAPVAVGAVGLGAAWVLRTDPHRAWRASWEEAVAAPRTTAAMAGVAVVAGFCFSLLFSRAMFQDAAGDLVTGYWIPDWAGHLITASSFSVSQNLGQDPLMSGTPLYYPFLPDFTSAMLMRLGLGAGPALWAPQVVLAAVLALLVVSFAARLGAHRSVGVIAMVICFLGGGLGFVGAFQDACTSAGNPVAECTASYALTHPASGLAIAAGTLHGLPGVVADQPRAYDGMATAPAAGTPVFSDQEWYTPLFAWWLPQRTLVEGFDTVVSVLLLLSAALRASPAPRRDVVVAGVLAGLLPVIHVQSLFALAILCAGLALMRWRPAWLLFAGVAAVTALPRLVELLGAPHGAAVTGNRYPWFEPGWMSKALGSTQPPDSVTAGNVLTGLGEVLHVPFTGGFWAFWVVNLGVAVPLSGVVGLAAVLAWLGRSPLRLRLGTLTSLAERAVGALPAPLLRFFLACLPVFVLANIVVFQSWDWDNTKLFVYWYLGVALVVGVIAVRLWAGLWRGLVAVLLVGSMVTTGALVAIRLIPHAPPCPPLQASQDACPPATSPLLGPFDLASEADRRMASRLEAETAPSAVFLIPDSSSSWEDPVALLTGRPVVMGWTGWLWSYGLDYQPRQAAVDAAYQGCGSTPLAACSTILAILQRYQVSYVEVDQTVGRAGADWWAAQHLPVVASAGSTVVYDVSLAGGVPR
jgi:hypothetical protein